jgi:hypothetical protein
MLIGEVASRLRGSLFVICLASPDTEWRGENSIATARDPAASE